ncbi:MAG: HAD family hydrolase [Acidimicrobiia bacterium]|nr:HAD family hydrolase [Acidimicrobiia bacterium]
MNGFKAVLFDVDFTLIYPGPMFQAEGYQVFCRRYGMDVDPSAFDAGVASAARILDTPDEAPYDEELYVAYTRHIIERMGGRGPTVDPCAREIYREWAACHHFELYDEVPDVLRSLAEDGIRVGLVSNSHRSLASFESHFALDGLIAASVSSSEHGMMKPHPSIFRAVLDRMAVAPSDALMVGDSIRHDVEGALRTGMRAVLLHRSEQPHPRASELTDHGVPVIRSLRELPWIIVGR